MPLIDLKTNLKDLKYGHDEPGGANSNEPYVATRIPATNEPLQTGFSITGNNIGQGLGTIAAGAGAGALIGAIGGSTVGAAGAGALIGAGVGAGIGIAGASLTQDFSLGLKIPTAGTGGPDFLLRGGLLLPDKIADDEKRLFKFFKDTKGILFTVKQNLLSRVSVNTQASPKFLNDGVYTPISTLLEAAGVPFGLHVNKQGLNPFGGFLGKTTYSEIINDKIKPEDLNRLVLLSEAKIYNSISVNPLTTKISPDETEILRYGGGPNSILGIGKTHIYFADQRTGVNNPLYLDEYRYLGYNQKKNLRTYLYRGEIRDVPIDLEENIQRFLQASVYYGVRPYTNNSLASTISEITPNTTLNLQDPNNSNTETYTGQEIRDISSSPNQNGESFYIGKQVLFGTSTPGDFRAKLRQRNNIIAQAPNYRDINLQSKQYIGLGDPGQLNKNTSDYTKAASDDSYDLMNAWSIYRKEQVTDWPDLVPFRIEVLENNNPSLKMFIHFRAFLDNISDNYTSNWETTKYIGRGENFYTYSGFDRNVSLSWTVAAQSKMEIINMYKRLNYLASVCAPDYSPNGYMRGNIVKLTVGGYFHEQYGIIKGFSYEMNDENDTWEIGINLNGEPDDTVKPLPHIIRVKSFNFIPIHDFVPRKQQIGFDGDTPLYGPERYIALRSDSHPESNYGEPYYEPTSTQQSDGETIPDSSPEPVPSPPPPTPPSSPYQVTPTQTFSAQGG